MEELLSQMDINRNANLDDLTNHFAAMLPHLKIDWFLDPNANEIKMFLRAVLFVNGNLEIHGQALEQKLKECQQIPKNELQSILANFHKGVLIDDVCKKLLMTKTGPNHILEIQNFCNDFLGPSRYVSILQSVQEARCSKLVTDEVVTEAKFLITKIFQLKSANGIDVAIKKLLNIVSFDVLAPIINFNEPHTYYFMKCLLVQKEICSGLENGSISEHFINSMYETSCRDDNGLSTYMKCLQNARFAKSLMEFFIKYLIATADENRETGILDVRIYEPVHMSFLIAGMLSSKSDCRVKFHKKLAAMPHSVEVCLNISHLNLIYNF